MVGEELVVSLDGLTLFAVAEDWPTKKRGKAGSSPLKLVRNDKKAGSSPLKRVRNDKSEEIASLGSGRNDKAGAADKRARPGRVVTSKELGEAAEADFLAKASGMGLWAAKPWGDSRRYDFIVDANGRLQRVQVKSAHRESRDGGYSLRLHGSSQKAYRADEIEALVAYIVPEKAWYVFPVSAVQKMRSVKLFPGRVSRSKYEKYREAWEILTGGVRA